MYESSDFVTCCDFDWFSFESDRSNSADGHFFYLTTAKWMNLDIFLSPV